MLEPIKHFLALAIYILKYFTQCNNLPRSLYRKLWTPVLIWCRNTGSIAAMECCILITNSCAVLTVAFSTLGIWSTWATILHFHIYNGMFDLCPNVDSRLWVFLSEHGIKIGTTNTVQGSSAHPRSWGRVHRDKMSFSSSKTFLCVTANTKEAEGIDLGDKPFRAGGATSLSTWCYPSPMRRRSLLSLSPRYPVALLSFHLLVITFESLFRKPFARSCSITKSRGHY